MVDNVCAFADDGTSQPPLTSEGDHQMSKQVRFHEVHPSAKSLFAILPENLAWSYSDDAWIGENVCPDCSVGLGRACVDANQMPLGKHHDARVDLAIGDSIRRAAAAL